MNSRPARVPAATGVGVAAVAAVAPGPAASAGVSAGVNVAAASSAAARRNRTGTRGRRIGSLLLGGGDPRDGAGQESWKDASRAARERRREGVALAPEEDGGRGARELAE